MRLAVVLSLLLAVTAATTPFIQAAHSQVQSVYDPAIPENVPPAEDPPVEVNPCPDNPGTGQMVQDMYGNYFWKRDPRTFCHKLEEGWDQHAAYCRVNSRRSDDWTHLMAEDPGTVCCSANRGQKGWNFLLQKLNALEQNNPDACFVCACIRGDHEDGGDGCFPPGVLIQMADGSQKPIEAISKGDLVWNARTGRSAVVKQVIEGPEKLPLIKLGFADTVVTVSQQHPVLTKDGLKQARDVTLNDSVYDARGVLQRLTVLEQLPAAEGQRVINLVLDAEKEEADQRMMVSGGIITGDIMLQKQLAEQQAAKK